MKLHLLSLVLLWLGLEGASAVKLQVVGAAVRSAAGTADVRRPGPGVAFLSESQHARLRGRSQEQREDPPFPLGVAHVVGTVSDGDMDELESAPPVAPEDQIGPGIEEQGEKGPFGIFPKNYKDPVSYHPMAEDRPDPFPQPYPDKSVKWSRLNSDYKKNEGEVALRNQKLGCLTSPKGWKDTRGYGCDVYAALHWCMPDGREGPGWATGGKGQPFNAYAATGYDAKMACCECGGGFEFVVSVPNIDPLEDRRVVAPQDRLLPGPQGQMLDRDYRHLDAIFPAHPVSPRHPLYAPMDHLENSPYDDRWAAGTAPHDQVPVRYAHFFRETYEQSLRSDPMGLSVRFYGAPPGAACAGDRAFVKASAIDRALEYTDANRARNLQWPAMTVARSGGFFWGKWTSTVRIFKPGRYIFNLDIGFSTQSSIKVDGLELVTYGQCKAAVDQGDCEAKHCIWMMEDSSCLPPKATTTTTTVEVTTEESRLFDPMGLTSTGTTTTTTAMMTTAAPEVAERAAAAPPTAEAATVVETTTTSTEPPCPRCADLLCLTPVEVFECPAKPHMFPPCDEVGPGEICETDGGCETSTRLNNCGNFDVYRKALAPAEGAAAAAAAEAPSTEKVEFSFVIGNVDYTQLEADLQTTAALKDQLKQVMASVSGDKFAPDAVTLMLSAGSVRVYVTIACPAGIPADEIKALLGPDSSLQDTMTAAVATMPAVDALSTGSVTIMDIVFSEGGPAPAPAAAAMFLAVNETRHAGFLAARPAGPAPAPSSYPGPAPGPGPGPSLSAPSPGAAPGPSPAGAAPAQAPAPPAVLVTPTVVYQTEPAPAPAPGPAPASPAGSGTWLLTDTQAGEVKLHVEDVSEFKVGDGVIINPGGQTEEYRKVARFGSIIVSMPLEFDHKAGEPIVPAEDIPPAPPSPGPWAQLGDKPGELILSGEEGDGSAHCLDITVMVTGAGRELALTYQGPDTEMSVVVIPGQVLFCDPVIEACDSPEMAVCDNFRDASCPPPMTTPEGWATSTTTPLCEAILTSDAKPGDMLVEVDTQDCFYVGEEIHLGSGANYEENIVSGFGSIMLKFPLKFRHFAGERMTGHPKPGAPGPAPEPGTVAAAAGPGGATTAETAAPPVPAPAPVAAAAPGPGPAPGPSPGPLPAPGPSPGAEISPGPAPAPGPASAPGPAPGPSQGPSGNPAPGPSPLAAQAPAPGAGNAAPAPSAQSAAQGSAPAPPAPAPR
eukprot:TRINITY_DN110825_c0_g1_i1.p1 TRINITY_DN110825_c0_g1~~TRINITY_DN110825_c0_g1_i1.p1  ORF type:complete len:1225 (-),score=222.94 TRINITY_DN110825_c0_g1_i1:89-3763(-)